MLRWYDAHARALPWRTLDRPPDGSTPREPDPYAVWVSEIMLQQTTVATVARRFGPFLAEFPTIAALAAAEEQRVLRAWEGLGYYRRARQLHRAARLIVERHDARFPDQWQAICDLPGIGRYTAGAIYSIAFDRPAPILEANTRRLFARLLGQDADTASLWATAEALVSRHRPGALNQAMMELGARICLSREPRCEVCPVAALCEARRQGRQQEIPAPKGRPTLTDLHEVAVLIRRRGRVLLRQCQEGDRWAGLWDFPRLPMPDVPSDKLAGAIAADVERLTGVPIELGERLTTLRHGVTRYRIRLDAYSARATMSGTAPRDAHQKWPLAGQLDRYPLSTTGRKLAELFAARRGTGQ